MKRRHVLRLSWLLTLAGCATSTARPRAEAGLPCRSAEVTPATHDRYVAMLRTIFSTSAGVAIQEEVGLRSVDREEVQPWHDSDAGCAEVVALALEKLTSQHPDAHARLGTSPFLVVRVVHYPVLVAQGWTGHLTPAVLLKGPSPDSYPVFMVAN